MKNKESWWYNSVQVQRPENQVGGWCISQSQDQRHESQIYCWWNSQTLKAQDPGAPISKRRRIWTPAPAQGEKEFALLPPFCSVQALSRSDDACPQWWGVSSLFSLLIQMLTSLQNTPTIHPETFYQISEYPLTQSSWHVQVSVTDSRLLMHTLNHYGGVEGERRHWHTNNGTLKWKVNN